MKRLSEAEETLDSSTRYLECSWELTRCLGSVGVAEQREYIEMYILRNSRESLVFMYNLCVSLDSEETVKYKFKD